MTLSYQRIPAPCYTIPMHCQTILSVTDLYHSQTMRRITLPLPDCTTPNPCCTSLYYTIAKHIDTGHRSTQLNFAIAERNDPRPRDTYASQNVAQLYRCHMSRHMTSPLLFLTLPYHCFTSHRPTLPNQGYTALYSTGLNHCFTGITI
jgi:hypothetical protein